MGLTLEINMTSATALHRNYSIDLAQDVQGWRVISVTHYVNGSRLLRLLSSTRIVLRRSDKRERLSTCSFQSACAGSCEGL
jgi:hypothetical protein